MRKVELSAEANFSLGALRVRPAACEIDAGGEVVRVQPRVMQVLIALAREGGEAVSREALIASCWDGLSVSQDAVNRSVQLLRRAVAGCDPDAASIETLPKIGYRLTVGPGRSAPAAGRRRAAGVRLGLTALALAAWVFWPRPPGDWIVAASTRLIATPLIELYPAISPDGTRLAYSAGPDITSRHIYVVRLSGGDPVQLTADPYDDSGPDWSPKGDRLVYVAAHTGEPCRFMSVSAGGGAAREIGRCRIAERSRAVWTPRGDGLLISDVATADRRMGLFRLDLASGARVPLTRPPLGYEDSSVAISPDGRSMAYIRSGDQEPCRVMALDLDSGAERTIDVLDAEKCGVAWSADSRALLVADGDGRDSWIWSYPAAGGPRRRIFETPLGLGRLAAGPRGLLAAEVANRRANAAFPPDVAGGRPKIVDAAGGVSWSPRYAPDGSLAELSNRSRSLGLWLTRPGARSRLLTSFAPYGVDTLTWSAGGDRLAMVVSDRDRRSLQVWSPEGRRLASFPIPGNGMGAPTWTASGRGVIYPARDSGGWRLWRLDFDRPVPRPITAYGWTGVRSLGDALYAVAADRPGIWRLDPRPHRITDKGPGRFAESWTLHDGQLIFADPSDHRLWRAPLAGGPASPWLETPEAHDVYGLDFDIEPKSGRPVYSALIENDFDIELFHLVRH